MELGGVVVAAQQNPREGYRPNLSRYAEYYNVYRDNDSIYPYNLSVTWVVRRSP
jgi:hypothetical protein